MGSWNAIVLDLCFSIYFALTSQPRVSKGCHGKWLGREGATLTPRLSVSGRLRKPLPCRALSLYRFAAANQLFCCAKASGNLCCALVFHEQNRLHGEQLKLFWPYFREWLPIRITILRTPTTLPGSSRLFQRALRQTRSSRCRASRIPRGAGIAKQGSLSRAAARAYRHQSRPWARPTGGRERA